MTMKTRTTLLRAVLLLSVILTSPQTSQAQWWQQKRKKNVVGETVKGAAIGAALTGLFGGDKKDREKAAKVGAALGALGALDKNRRLREEQERARQEQMARIEAERLALQRQMQAEAEARQRQQLIERERLARQQSQQLVYASPPAQSQQNMDATTLVKHVQRSLVVLGMTKPPITGIVDSETRNAILKYQKIMSIPTSGIANKFLLDHLWANGG